MRAEDLIPKKEIPKEALPSENVSEKKGSDKFLIYGILFIIGAVIAVIFVPQFFNQPETLNSLHEKNLEGKLSPNVGYLEKGQYSFVLFEDLWYTRLETPTGTRQFNIPFHYPPRDVEDIEPVGFLNYSLFDRYDNFYMTFDPTDEELGYIGVSIGETDQVLIDVFGKGVIAACVKNETNACANRPIIDCDSTNVPVFYFSSEDETNVIYLNNCIVVSGRGEDLFRATDRMLFDLLGILR